ncbi:DNA/RNA polymerase [Hyaloscypha variabilis F]|uniref:DNA-directed RNA polymerase n=1 Tax=Hyaloscypha variabilis (strain UAMH 11265 / GT02V1 / F) TaxID=1149755 RepID=A0A2J6RCI1_HYAVF|nr:DNA/RNA polymerase [Hyaloscypha variabilis F]
MLVRAARRKARPEVLRSRFSFEQSSLSSNPIHRGRRRLISIEAAPQTFRSRKRTSSKDASSQPRRAMATAVTYTGLEDIPFETIGDMPPATRRRIADGSRDMPGFPHSHLRELDPLQTVRLEASLAHAPSRIRSGRRIGIGGQFEEVQSVFDACLQIGRIERAGIILKRIASAQQVYPEDLLALHNRYLRAAVEEIMINPTQSATQNLHSWFELEIRSKAVPANTETVAYMVKASLQSPKGKRERLVRRYMDMLEEDAALQLLEAEVLTAHEINSITQIYPKYNFTDEMLEDIEMVEDEEPISPAQLSTDSTIPDVRPTDQKGLGLKSLKKSLSLFSSLPDEGVDIANSSPEARRKIQARLEEDAVSSAIDRWREEAAHLSKMGVNSTLQTKSLGARMWKWQLALEEHLKEEIVKIDASELAARKDTQDQERCFYGPFLRILPVEKLAAITILACMSTLSAQGADKGIPLSSSILAIAGSVEDETTFETVQRNSKKKMWPRSKKEYGRSHILTPELVKKATRGRGPGSASRFALQYMSKTEHADSWSHRTQWPTAVKAKVGAFLMSSLIEVAKVPVSLTHPKTQETMTQMQPAFSHSHQYRLGKKLGVIIANKALVAQLKREPVHSLLAKHLPMLVSPEPWTEFSKGGFISHPGKVMRIKAGDKDQRYYAEAAIGQGEMSQTFKGLDILGKTSWRINQEVFDVMLEAWNSGEAIANIPPETPDLQMPPEPESTNDPLERRRWIRAVKLVENARGGMHSQRCFQNFQLEIARALRNEVFYFPHNIDFRGRAYPIPPYLNHMGADHCRGLLKFGEGKELGNSGMKWLSIHLANVFGYDKASLLEREQFTANHMAEIYDSASKPLNGNKWWLKAEDPWQCLAACMEIRNAIESGDPTRFVSHLPVHQDGTCNGLQHYAALGGDVWGARQVNLEPGDRPADVYTAVANLVKESIAEDKAKGDAIAAILADKITRKVVKQTVMTNVYGVTYVGAKAQVRKQLVAAHPDLPNTDQLNPGHLSSYVATKIFKALSTMFRGAHDIQYWLGECASRISMSLTQEQLSRLEAEWPRLTSKSPPTKSDRNYTPPAVDDLVQFKTSVIWTNPLHMPVVQPYRNSKTKSIVTHMQKLNLSEPHRSDPVSRRKQLQGFPPNYIHSLDATHMLLSALRCDELGLSFAAVHDSFWTHAKDIETMNTVLRDTFIRIHTEDVVGRLAAEFSARYKNGMYLANIRVKAPVYKKIQAWRASKEQARSVRVPKSKHAPRLDELMMECERMKLLRSSDPEEVEKGKSMVTPGSIFETMALEGDLTTDKDIETLGLGDMSLREARLRADQEIAVGDPTNIEEIHNPLPGGMGAETDMDATAESFPEENQDNEADTASEGSEKKLGKFEQRITGQILNREADAYSQIWLPLTFPPVPKKAEFDVSRLKDSKYFFS